MKPKPIIIDKDAFEGMNLNDLCNFARDHFLILPMVLHDECAKNKEKRQQLFKRFRKIILSDGYICQAGRDIVEKEAQTLQPYGFLADLDKTARWQKEFKKGAIIGVPNENEIVHAGHVDSAETLLSQYKKVVGEVGQEIFKAAVNEVKRSKADRQQRFKIWTQVVEDLDIHKLSVHLLSQFGGSPEKYCPSSDWVTWHYLRIAAILTFEYKFLEGKPGKNQLTNAVHDLQDSEYVFLLSRADGLLTRDKKLVTPLAKAAFPEKDVFSSLDEVPEEYICHWS